jgi:hypothetical protein
MNYTQKMIDAIRIELDQFNSIVSPKAFISNEPKFLNIQSLDTHMNNIISSPHLLNYFLKVHKKHSFPAIEKFFSDIVQYKQNSQIFENLLLKSKDVIPQSSFFQKILTPKIVDSFFLNYQYQFNIHYFLSLSPLQYFQNPLFQSLFYTNLQHLEPTSQNVKKLLTYFIDTEDPKVFESVTIILQNKFYKGEKISSLLGLIEKIETPSYKKQLLLLLDNQEKFFISEKSSIYSFSINFSTFKDICKKYKFNNPTNVLHNIQIIFHQMREQNHPLFKDFFNDYFLQFQSVKHNSYVEPKLKTILLNQFSFQYFSEEDKYKKLETLKNILILFKENAQPMPFSEFNNFFKKLVTKTAYHFELDQNLVSTKNNDNMKYKI